MKQAILATALALIPVAGLAQDDPDLIAGFRTNDFIRMLPNPLVAVPRQSYDSNPATHRVMARYIDPADQRDRAQVLIYAWPPEAPEAVEDSPEIRARLIETQDAELERTDRSFERREITTPDGNLLNCVMMEHDGGEVLETMCSMPVKGRLADMSTISRLDGRSRAEINALHEVFGNEFFDAIAAAE